MVKTFSTLRYFRNFYYLTIIDFRKKKIIRCSEASACLLQILIFFIIATQVNDRQNFSIQREIKYTIFICSKLNAFFRIFPAV